MLTLSMTSPKSLSRGKREGAGAGSKGFKLGLVTSDVNLNGLGKVNEGNLPRRGFNFAQ